MSQPIKIDERENLVLKVNWQKAVKVFLILVAAGVSYLLDLPGLTDLL